MHVLFCSTGISALGESFSQAIFAKELIDSGHQCFFIAPKLGGEYLLTFNFKKDTFLTLPNEKDKGANFDININKGLFDKFVKKIKPDYIILADWHHYKPDGVANNNTYSLSWFDEKTPMGTFDHNGFAPEGYGEKEMKLGINKSVNYWLKQNFKYYIPVPKRINFIIRPCPHHSNSYPYKNDIYYWAIYKEKLNKNNEAIENIKKKYSLKNKKSIFQPIGLWQERIMELIVLNNNLNYDYYSDTFFPIVLNSLSKVNHEIVYFVISLNTKQEETVQYKNVTFVKLPPVKQEVFMDYLLASDVFFTDNLMNSSMGKGTFGNTFPLVFKNSVYQDDNGYLVSSFKISENILEKISVLKDNHLIIPHRSFPIGLYELERMYDNNSFTSCFIEQELYDEEGMTQLFMDVFNKNSLKERITEAQDKYIQDNQKLFSAERILRSI